MMKLIKPLYLLLVLFMLLLGCKSQSLETSAPFEINEKAYFYWVSPKQGTEGTTIRIAGRTKSLNVSFSKLFFQNHEYDVVPEYNSGGFIIEGTNSEFRKKDKVMHKDPAAEYGNEVSKIEKKIPFDLQNDEAILLYSVNGLEGYHKIKDIKQLDKVYMP